METTETHEDGAWSQQLPAVSYRAHLFVVLECDRVAAGGARYEITGIDEVVIGRGSERKATKETQGDQCRLNVAIPGRSMSQVHARLRRRGADWILEDARSTNGSFVNGQRVDKAALSDGDCIELGRTLFTIRTALQTPPDAPEHVDWLDDKPAGEKLTTALPALGSAFREIATFARAGVPIVIVGRTGTGKEVLSKRIHAMSGRAGPFVAVNCGALPPNLVESQLFGHVRGAFSGAVGSELGFIRAADHGTLLLDEIDELPASAQVALLRVLQESEVVPVGNARPVRVDMRVIAATHEPLSELVARKRLRDDLRGRLEGYVVDLPPLAERREDLGILVAELLASIGGGSSSLHPAVGRLLWSHGWPLNIRELEHALRHAAALAQGERIYVRHLPASLSLSASGIERSLNHGALGPRSAGRSDSPAAGPRLQLSEADAQLRRDIICRLEEHRGNIAAVAKSMGKARTQVQRWLQRFGVDAGVYRH